MYVFHSFVSFPNQLDTTKKTWIPTAVAPRTEALALPIIMKRQREAHAEYKHALVPHNLRYARVRMYIRKRRTK